MPAVQDLVVALGGAPPRHLGAPDLLVRHTEGPSDLARYRSLRRRVFVEEQELFARTDVDEYDDHPRTIVLVAEDGDGELLGGVRLHPQGEDPELGWWQGGRLVCGVDSGRGRRGVGAALVRAACAIAELEGALRFDATVQAPREGFFARLGWERVGETEQRGIPHVRMRWPIDRIARLVEETKAPLGALLEIGQGAGAGWLGDDGVPVPGSSVVAAVDAIAPAMVARDPEWAGWCGMLVAANDLAAMGAERIGALDSVAAPDRARVERVLRGVRDGARAFGLPILGGHTQVGAPGALSVTGLGRAGRPVPGGGGHVGDEVRLTTDLSGGWRPGYTGSQWDSTSGRSSAEIDAMLDTVRRLGPRAAKDVSMAGIAGTLGMLAEASGCGAELRAADIARPAGAGLADWITCFPGFGMLTADAPGAATPSAAPATSVVCGGLSAEPGVRIVWPDGETTVALAGAATGLGEA